MVITFLILSCILLLMLIRFIDCHNTPWVKFPAESISHLAICMDIQSPLFYTYVLVFLELDSGSYIVLVPIEKSLPYTHVSHLFISRQFPQLHCNFMFIRSIVQKENEIWCILCGVYAIHSQQGIFQHFLQQNSKPILKDADCGKLTQEISQQKNLKHKGQQEY